MNTNLKIWLYLLIFLSFSSCKKEESKKEDNIEYIQYFSAKIGGKNIDIKNSINGDRFKLHGSWTGINNDEVHVYQVKVNLPEERNEIVKYETLLNFQIYDIERNKVNNIIDNEFYQNDFNSYIFLSKTMIDDDKNYTIYSPNTNKKPFKIEITKYQFIKDSLVPIVGGKLNGVLYNKKNLLDSVIIKDGIFEVRF